jgi:hypothetical protein
MFIEQGSVIAFQLFLVMISAYMYSPYIRQA